MDITESIKDTTEDIFHEVEELPVTLGDFEIESHDWRVHILKQIKANQSQGYTKFARSLYVQHDPKVRIDVFITEGDEIRMYGSGHLSFELTKRGSTPDKDRSYSFGFGPESIQENESDPEPRAGPPHFTALGLTSTAVFNPRLAASGVGVVSNSVGSLKILGSSRGCFFSPDPWLEKQINVCLGEPKDTQANFVLGRCKIGKDQLSLKLAKAMNRVFHYVNTKHLTSIKGNFKDNSPYINMIVPQKWSMIPRSCRFGDTDNCASFFQKMIGKDLIECALNKFYVTDPGNCKFAKHLSCDDCEMRDFNYVSGDKFGGKMKRLRPTLRKKRRTFSKQTFRR